MHDGVITSPDQMTAEWLDAALRRGGALSGGVAGYTLDGEASTTARMARIAVAYRPDTADDPPERLLLKLSGDAFGPSEVDYYTRDYRDLPDAPIPRCYDGRYDATRRAYHLLLEDLSATHRDSWEIAPTPAYGRAVAEAQARLHAHRWGVERFGAVGATMPDEATIRRYIDHIRQGLAPLLADLGDQIPQDWRTALREIFAWHPEAMLARTRDPQGFCLIHGDTNPGNILSPRDGAGPVYLIDRQPFDWSLTVWLGVSDIAYTMVHWWDTEPRRCCEQEVLRRYHQALGERGVAGYSWEQLLRDYRLAAVQSVYVAVEWCASEADRTGMRWVWWPQLQKAMQAYFDLDCGALRP